MSIPNEITADLRQRLASVLYCDDAEISEESTFRDLGLDSVLAVELITGINEKYGLEGTIDTVYDHPSVATLSAYIRDGITRKIPSE